MLAGTSGDLDAIAATLAVLSPATYGHVLIELPQGADLAPLAAPARVTVMVVHAADEIGTALTRALTAWQSEWTSEHPECAPAISRWVGPKARTLVGAQFDGPGATIEIP